MIAIDILLDGAFAALAGIGFMSISNPPRMAYPAVAVLAAVGHSIRFVLMNIGGMSISLACLFAALSIGFLSIPAARIVRCPAETFSFPSLLPMIPGMYAYRTVQAIVNCLQTTEESEFMHWLYMLAYNGLTAICAIMLMVIGVTLPIFMFKKYSFDVTREVKPKGV